MSSDLRGMFVTISSARHFYATELTLSRFKWFPSLVQLTYSTGGSAWTGQIITPSMPAGKYVSRDIRPTRAGSEMEEEEVITKSKLKRFLPRECRETFKP